MCPFFLIWSPTVCCWTKIPNGPPFFTAFLRRILPVIWGSQFRFTNKNSISYWTSWRERISSLFRVSDWNGWSVEKTRIRELNRTHGIPMDFVISWAIVTFQNLPFFRLLASLLSHMESSTLFRIAGIAGIADPVRFMNHQWHWCISAGLVSNIVNYDSSNDHCVFFSQHFFNANFPSPN